MSQSRQFVDIGGFVDYYKVLLSKKNPSAMKYRAGKFCC
jgi:hypothetical protein